jgi:hypothetical protein
MRRPGWPKRHRERPRVGKFTGELVTARYCRKCLELMGELSLDEYQHLDRLCPTCYFLENDRTPCGSRPA